jgi:6-pyruvoyltetrahydropterin/6-carboxytetrahydropterin synthase
MSSPPDDGLTVTKEFHFHAAHSVPGVADCKHVHGHTYHLSVTIGGEPGGAESPEEGMIANARRIKSEVKDAVVCKLDHAFIACGDERIVPKLKDLGYRVAEIGVRTTAENIAEWILQELREETSFRVLKVRLWETPSMYTEARA